MWRLDEYAVFLLSSFQTHWAMDKETQTRTCTTHTLITISDTATGSNAHKT